MSWVSTPPGYDYYDDGTDGNADDQDGEDDEGYDEDDGDGEEPWLDTPERLRLILGLVAEFTEGVVNKIESEVSHLLLLSPTPTPCLLRLWSFAHQDL